MESYSLMSTVSVFKTKRAVEMMVAIELHNNMKVLKTIPYCILKNKDGKFSYVNFTTKTK